MFTGYFAKLKEYKHKHKGSNFIVEYSKDVI